MMLDAPLAPTLETDADDRTARSAQSRLAIIDGDVHPAMRSSNDLKPYLPALPMEKTLCFFGHDEVADQETACVFPEMAKSTLVERPGGHHFDGNYEPVARMILDRLKPQKAASR